MQAAEPKIRENRSKPNKCCQSSRLWQQCSGTGVVFCWWTLCLKEQLPTQVPTVQLYGSSESIAKQTTRHAVKRCFAPPPKRKASNHYGVNRIFWLRGFGLCTIQPQPCSE
ncbi:hypothetical protein TNCV_787241 [Trichonephila clavipes]|nr:hypothetical protein TNCV_787241 [Trichonephila clavipes]